jgi:hypothetical protein
LFLLLRSSRLWYSISRAIFHKILFSISVSKSDSSIRTAKPVFEAYSKCYFWAIYKYCRSTHSIGSKEGMYLYFYGPSVSLIQAHLSVFKKLGTAQIAARGHFNFSLALTYRLNQTAAILCILLWLMINVAEGSTFLLISISLAMSWMM